MLYTQRSAHKWAMHSNELRALLGFEKGLPDEGMPPRNVLGVVVWVLPKPLGAGRRRSSKHRVLATCPQCWREMSAGRLVSQHLKHCKGGVK